MFAPTGTCSFSTHMRSSTATLYWVPASAMTAKRVGGAGAGTGGGGGVASEVAAALLPLLLQRARYKLAPAHGGERGSCHGHGARVATRRLKAKARSIGCGRGGDCPLAAPQQVASLRACAWSGRRPAERLGARRKQKAPNTNLCAVLVSGSPPLRAGSPHRAAAFGEPIPLSAPRSRGCHHAEGRAGTEHAGR